MHVIGNSCTNYVRSDLQKKEHRRGVFKRLQPPLENRVLLEVEVDVQNVVVRSVQVAVALVASSPTSRSSWSRPCSGFEPAMFDVPVLRRERKREGGW